DEGSDEERMDDQQFSQQARRVVRGLGCEEDLQRYCQHRCDVCEERGPARHGCGSRIGDRRHETSASRVFIDKGKAIVATTPCGAFLVRLSCAVSPYMANRRARMLARPVPDPDDSEKPRPESAIRTRIAPRLCDASMRTMPPCGSGARPCFTAFSARVSSVSGG